MSEPENETAPAETPLAEGEAVEVPETDSTTAETVVVDESAAELSPAEPEQLPLPVVEGSD